MSTTTFDYTGGAQTFTASKSGWYRIDAFGAEGGASDTSFASVLDLGGKGAEAQGDVYLTAGETITVLVGGQGGDGHIENGGKPYVFMGGGGGGGGGSFVIGPGGTPLVVAGGGGGASATNAGIDGQITTSGSSGTNFEAGAVSAGGTAGSGGKGGPVTATAPYEDGGGGGGGLLSAGTPGDGTGLGVNGGGGGAGLNAPGGGQGGKYLDSVGGQRLGYTIHDSTAIGDFPEFLDFSAPGLALAVGGQGGFGGGGGGGGDIKAVVVVPAGAGFDTDISWAPTPEHLAAGPVTGGGGGGGGYSGGAGGADYEGGGGGGSFVASQARNVGLVAGTKPGNGRVTISSETPVTVVGAPTDVTIYNTQSIQLFANAQVTNDPSLLASGSSQETLFISYDPTAGSFSNLGTAQQVSTVFGPGAGLVLSGSGDEITQAVRSLVFTPNRNFVPSAHRDITNIGLLAEQGSAGSAPETAFSYLHLLIVAADTPPTITGTVAHQSVVANSSYTPLSSVTISDLSPHQNETVTITVTDGVKATDSRGVFYSTLSKLFPIIHTGLGTYSVSGAPSFVSATLNFLTFQTLDGGTPGQTVTTGITITVTNDLGATAVDTSTTLDYTYINSATVVTGTSTATLSATTSTPSTGGTLSAFGAGATPSSFQAPAQSALAGTYGTFSFNATTGVWGYTLDESRAATRALLNGQQVTDTLKIVSLDGQAPATITVTVVGTNYAPMIAVNGATTRQLSERMDLTGSSQLDRVSGIFGFTDQDSADVHTATVSAPTIVWSGGPLASAINPGSLSVTPRDLGGGGTVSWTYSAPDSAFDFLAAGQTLAISYTVTIDDGRGARASQPVTITVTGSNDAASFTGSGTGTVVEDGARTATGRLTVTDPDAGEARFQTPAALTGTYGSFAFDPASGAWTYALNNAAANVQALAVGQQVTDTLTVTSLDGTASQPLTVTITGTNDAPVIAGSTMQSAGAITELANQTGATTADIASGTIGFTDVDLTDTHSASAGAPSFTWSGGSLTAAQQSALATAGRLAVIATDSSSGGTVAWTYSAPDAAFDFLATGQTLAISYVVTIDDGHGGQAMQPVTITVTGSNDTASIAGGSSASVTEDGTVTSMGTLTVTDPDAGQSSFRTPASLIGTYGSFTFNPATGAWTYALNNAAANVQALAAGQQVTDTLTVTSLDGTASQILTATITGTNDAPVITGPAASSGTITELAKTTGSSTADVASGTFSYTDVDLTDTHVATAGAPSFTWSGGSLTTAQQNALATAGRLAVTATDSGGGGTVAWTFSAPDAAFDFLAAGQTLAIGYTVTIDDGHGGQATQPVTITVTGSNDAPIIAGAVARQTDTDDLSIKPFSTAQVTDADINASDSLTITLTDPSNGTLTGANLTGTAGVYTLSAQGPAALTAALRNVVFIPTAHQVAPGNTVQTGFTLKATDDQGAIASDGSTTVITTAVNDKSTIAGTHVSQTTDLLTSTPFVNVQVTNPDNQTGVIHTVTISETGAGAKDVLGRLSYGGTGASFKETANGSGVYTLTGTLAQVNAALPALVFTPKPGVIPSRQSQQVGFSLTDAQTSAGTSSISAIDANSVLTVVRAAHNKTTVNLSGSSNTVSAPATEAPYSTASGPTINGPLLGFATVNGSGASETINASGFFNTILANGGDDVINAGLGSAKVTVSDGDGAVTVTGNVSNSTVTLGDGDDVIALQGSLNKVTLGNGNSNLTTGSGLNTISLGSGNNTVRLNGASNQVTLGAGKDVVFGGLADTIAVNGTTLVLKGGLLETVTVGAAGATIDDLSSSTTVRFGTGSGSLTLQDITSDSGFVLNFIGGVGGFSNYAAVAKSLISDGHGGTELIVRGGANPVFIDFANTPASYLTGQHFRFG